MHIWYLLFRQSVSVGWIILARADRLLGLRISFFADFERLSVFSKLLLVVVLSRSDVDIATFSEACWPRWRWSKVDVGIFVHCQSVSSWWLILARPCGLLDRIFSFFADFKRLSVRSELLFVIVLTRCDIYITSMCKTGWSGRWLAHVYVRRLMPGNSFCLCGFVFAWPHSRLLISLSFLTDFERLSVRSKLLFVVVLSRSDVNIATLGKACWSSRWRADVHVRSLVLG